MADQDDYILRRNYTASVRLNVQHAYWTDMFGYLLHPSIPLSSSSEGLSIIDVGTGTGNWLLAVQQQLKVPIKTLLGTDISDSQFPHHTWLPEKVKLMKLDMLDPNGPPEELRGQFDIVHARYLIFLVKDNKPDDIIDFFSKLLKPGGHLQWGEPYYNSYTEPKPVSISGSAEGLKTVMDLLINQRPCDWLNEFDKNLRPFGLEIAAIDRRSPPPWQRGWYADNWCMIADELAPHLNMSRDEVRTLIEKVNTETKQGSWIDRHFQTVVARKKL